MEHGRIGDEGSEDSETSSPIHRVWRCVYPSKFSAMQTASRKMHSAAPLCLNFVKSIVHGTGNRERGCELLSASGVALEDFTAELRGHLFFISQTDSPMATYRLPVLFCNTNPRRQGDETTHSTIQIHSDADWPDKTK